MAERREFALLSKRQRDIYTLVCQNPGLTTYALAVKFHGRKPGQREPFVGPVSGSLRALERRGLVAQDSDDSWHALHGGAY